MNFVWNGPKISKYGNKFLGIYNLQIPKDKTPKEFKTIKQHLRHNEFRTVEGPDQIDIYQFVCPITPANYNLYKKGKVTLEMSSQDIYKYAMDRHATSISPTNMSAPQLQNRKNREKKWKDWYEEYKQQFNEIQSRKKEFLERINKEDLSEKNRSKLLEFQRPHARSLLFSLKQNQTALDASDTGTGKTYTALCLAEELGLTPIIVCPKSVIPGWHTAAKHFGIKKYYVSNYEQFRLGNTSYLKRGGVNPHYTELEKIQIPISTSLNFRKGVEQERSLRMIKEQLSRIPKKEYTWLLDPEEHLLIFDECHKTKNPSTLNYAIYWWAKQQGLRTLSLSATIADRIESAYGVCFMLGLIKDYTEFNMKFNVDMDKGILRDFGYEVNKQGFYRFNEKYRKELDELEKNDSSLCKLHSALFPIYGSRMVVADLGDAFPDNFIEAQTYDMDRKAKEIQSIYQDMEKKLILSQLKTIQKREEDRKDLEERQKNQDENDKSTILSTNDYLRLQKLRREMDRDHLKLNKLKAKLEKYGTKVQVEHLNKTTFDGEDENILTVMLRARQRVELLKADTIIDLANEFLEEKKSVVIFVNFNETLDYLKSNIGIKVNNKISLIHGGQTMKERQHQIEKFQNNEHKVIISNIRSGGVGISLHDVHGGHPRVSLISPSWSAQDLLQALGRIYRAEGKSKCLQFLVFCAGTIEDQICEVVKEKIETIHTINDGDLSCGLKF